MSERRAIERGLERRERGERKEGREGRGERRERGERGGRLRSVTRYSEAVHVYMPL